VPLKAPVSQNPDLHRQNQKVKMCAVKQKKQNENLRLPFGIHDLKIPQKIEDSMCYRSEIRAAVWNNWHASRPYSGARFHQTKKKVDMNSSHGWKEM
jgi:hypothetical protein